MKTTTVISTFFILLTISCQRQTAHQTDRNASSEPTSALPEDHCYAYDRDDDLIGLTITITGNRLQGQLAYAYSYKDRSTGTIEGVIKGDTLITNYTYWSQGRSRVREIIFLNRNRALIEGTGEVEESDGKTVYTNRSALKFDDSVGLQEIPCSKGGTLD